MSGLFLEGDTSQLEQLAAGIGAIGRQEFVRGMVTSMADRALELIQQEFEMSRDPYGNPWAPLKHPRPGGGPLQKTRKLQKGFRRRVSMGGFTVVNRVPYLGFHQSGTRHMVARKVFPEDRQVPARWMAEFERIAAEAVRRAMGQAA